MTGSHMSDLVCHDSGQFGFFVRGEEQSGIYIEESSWQGKGVYFTGVNYFDRKGHLRIGVTHDVLSDPVHVLGDDGVLNQFHGAVDHLGIFPAHADLGFQRVPVS